MTNINTEGLPPEMQARIADIIEKAKSNAITPVSGAVPNNVPQPPAPVQRPPSLMDHTIALRQEVDSMRQQVAAMGQVVEAVGQAVGSLYQMFQQQTEITDYSSGYEETQPGLTTDDY